MFGEHSVDVSHVPATRCREGLRLRLRKSLGSPLGRPCVVDSRETSTNVNGQSRTDVGAGGRSRGVHVCSRLKCHHQISGVEFQIAIPVASGPGGITFFRILVPAGLKDTHEILAVEVLVEVRVAGRAVNPYTYLKDEVGIRSSLETIPGAS